MKNLKLNYSLKSEKDKGKEALIYVMFTVKGKRYKISLGYKVVPEYWDSVANRVIVSSKQTQAVQREMKRINRFLKEFETAVKVNIPDVRVYEEDGKQDWVKGEVLDCISKIKGIEKKEEEKRNIKVLPFFRGVIDNMPNKVIKRTGKFIDYRTVQHHNIVYKRVEAFFEYQRYGEGSFQIFDRYYENEMEKWMLGVKEYSPNTVCATFSVMKVWLMEAEEKGLITDKSFHGWKSKGYDVQHIYLTDEELKAMYSIQFTEDYKEKNNIDYKSEIEKTRDLFILASQIGLRFTDLKEINKANWDIENRMIEIHTHKTGETVRVPLSSIAIEIFEKYEGKLPVAIDKGKYNRQLSRIGELAGITSTVHVKINTGGKIEVVPKKKNELITSHTARRSFATNLYKKCKNARMVMAFTGHKTEENFRKYICIDKTEMVDLARDFFD